MVPELNISKDAEVSAKLRKLVIAICATKEEVGRVTFDFWMQIV